MTKKHGSEFYKCKGTIIKVIDKFVAKIELSESIPIKVWSFLKISDETVKVDQNDLETVIPAIGKDMQILNGAYRGEKAILLEILEDRYMLRLKIKQGSKNGRIVETNYEDASKCL